jgi:hypothetical protein
VSINPLFKCAFCLRAADSFQKEKMRLNRFKNSNKTDETTTFRRRGIKKAEYCYSTPLKKENLEIHRQTKG